MTWSELFAAFLKKQNLGPRAAGAVLGVSPSKVHYWSKGSRPRDEKVRKRIERWSQGEVPADVPAPAESGASAVDGVKSEKAS